MDVRANGAARHREANHAGVGRGGHRVELVLTQAFIQQRLNFVHLHVVDVEAVTGAFEGVSHRADVRLRGAGSQRSYSQVNAIDTTGDAGHVTGDGRGGGVVRVLYEGNFRRQDCLDALCRLMAGVRICRAGGILEADGVKVNITLEQFSHDVDVELRRVRLVGLERQPHQRNTNLMMHPRVDNWSACFNQVIDVIHEVEVSVDCGAVLVHQLGLQRECRRTLGGQRDAGDRAGENLQIRLWADGLSNLRHAVERIFANIKERRLKPCAAAKLKVPDAGRGGRLDSRQDVLQSCFSTEYTLEPISKRGEHHPNFLF